MRVISLTYKYEDIELSSKFALFFRTMGVYVVEKFYDFEVNLQDELDFFRPDYGDVRLPDPFSDFDAEIYLVDCISRLEYLRSASPSKSIALVDQRFVPEEPGNIPCVVYDSTMLPEFPILLDGLLQKMENLLSEQEYSDCCEWAKLYSANDFYRKIFNIKYYDLCGEKLGKWKDQYDKILTYCGSQWESDPEDQEFWMQSQYEHTKYALLKIQHEMNIRSERLQQGPLFDVDGLLQKAAALERNGSNILASSIKCLIGEIYNDEKDEKNKAYEYFMSECICDQSYNSFVFFLKGEYWQDYVHDYDNARRYYYKSILIYPQYYRAWYKLGYCYYRKGEMVKAYNAFNALCKVLDARLIEKSMKPSEIILYFEACKYCADILYSKYANTDRAINFYLMAEAVWESAGETTFLGLLKKSDSKKKDLANALKSSMDIRGIYERLIKLYEMCGFGEKAQEYKQKIIV